MKKKVLTILVTGILMGVLAGCGTKEQVNEDTNVIDTIVDAGSKVEITDLEQPTYPSDAVYGYWMSEDELTVVEISKEENLFYGVSADSIVSDTIVVEETVLKVGEDYVVSYAFSDENNMVLSEEGTVKFFKRIDKETYDAKRAEWEVQTIPEVQATPDTMGYYYGKWELEGHSIEILENECVLDDLKMAETYGELIWIPMYNYDYTTGETTDEVIGFKTEFPKNPMYNEDGTPNENYDLRFPGCSITFENEEGTFFYIYMFEETGPDEEGYLAWNRGLVSITGNATRVQ